MTFKPGVYTISLSNVPSDYKGIGNFVYSSIFGAVYKEDENGIIKKTFTLTEPKTDVVYFYMPETEHKIGNKITYNVQIEEGTSATAYEEYKEKLTNIYLTEPLRKVGDYVDYIDYNNKKIVRNVKERVYTGKESWLVDNGDASYAFDSTEPYIKKSKGLLFSNIAFYTETKDDSKFSFKSSGAGYIEFNAFGKGYTSTTWKQYLANKYNSGSPVKVQYDIATPIEQTIDLPSIELLDGYNTLSINTEVSPSNVKLTTSK